MNQDFDPKQFFSSWLTKDPYAFMRTENDKTNTFFSSWNEIAAHLFRSQQAYMQSMMQEWWSNSMRQSWPYNYWTGSAGKSSSAEPAPNTDTVIEKSTEPAHAPVTAARKKPIRVKTGVSASAKTIRKPAGRASSKGR